MQKLTTIKVLVVAILCLGISLQTSFAQVAYQGNAQSSPPQTTSGNVAVVSNFNIPDGTNILLVVGTRIANSGATVNSINYNGVTYTTQEIQQAANIGGNQSLWAIPMGDVTGGGITADLTITWSSSGGGYGGIAASFSNVNQATPIDGSVNNTTTSVSVATGLAGNMAIDFIGAGSTPVFSAGSGQTGPVINAPVNSNANRISMSYELATGATTVMDWGNTGGSGALVHLGNNIIANSYLPVELTQFEATPKNELVELNWQTASEENNEGFEIQHSVNGQEWKMLDFVKGNGTTVEIQNYEFIDRQPMNGINYYRLKQIDFDGHFEYSNIVNVTVKQYNNEVVNIYPNPVQDKLTITNIENVENIVIYNTFGQVVKQLSQANLTSIDVSDLPKGVYNLKLQKTNGSVVTKQFVK